MKAVVAPPPTIEPGRDILARYEGSFASDRRLGGSEAHTETDSWVAVNSSDPDGSTWTNFDDQPRLKILPISETEFYLPGFDTRIEFIRNPTTGKANQFKFNADGSVGDFYRQ